MKRNMSISVKVVLILIISILISMSLFSTFVFYINKDQALLEIDTTSKNIANRISKNLKTSFWYVNMVDVRESMRLEMANKHVYSIIVKDHNNIIKASMIKEKGDIINKENINYEQFKNYGNDLINPLLIRRIINEEASVIGYVEVYFTDAFLHKSLNDMILRTIIQTLLISAIIILVIYISLQRFILHPISILDAYVNKFSTKDFTERVPELSGDEIGNLADGFNIMVKELENSFKKIEKQNEELEEKVKERTKELEFANRELTMRHEEMLNELVMAERVQQNIIPNEDTFSKIKGVVLGSDYLAMERIGGDIYDVIRVGENTYGFLIADVTGHGIPAALITTMVKVSFNTHSKRGKKPSEVLCDVNNEMVKFIGDLDYFLTAYYCMLNLDKGEITFSNAAHHPALLYRRNHNKIEKLDTKGFILGYKNDIKYISDTVSLQEGDRILLYTDGITEARSNDNKEYGYDRLLQFYKMNVDKRPQEFVDKLINDVQKFCGSRSANDDQSVLCIDFIHKTKTKNIKDNIQIGFSYIDEEEKNINETEKKNFDNNKINDIYKKALQLIKTNEYDKGSDMLNNLKETLPNSIKLINNLAVAYYKSGKYEKAHNLLTITMQDIKDLENLLDKNLNIVKKKID